MRGVNVADGTGCNALEAGWEDLVFAAVTALALFGVVVGLWAYPYGILALLAVILLAQRLFRPRVGDGATMLAAALLGTAGEWVEVSLGEWTYHGPELVWGLPIWIPLIWANLFALFRRLTRVTLFVVTWAGLPEQSEGRQRLFEGWGMLFVLYAVPALLVMEKPREVVLFYGVVIAVVVLFWNGDRDRTLLFWGGLLGAFGEFVCIQLGYWTYHNPYFAQWGVDVTLPLDWGLSAIILDRLGRLRERFVVRSQGGVPPIFSSPSSP